MSHRRLLRTQASHAFRRLENGFSSIMEVSMGSGKVCGRSTKGGSPHTIPWRRL